MAGGNGLGLESTAGTPVLTGKTRYRFSNLCFSYLIAPNHRYVSVTLLEICIIYRLFKSVLFTDELLVLNCLQTVGIFIHFSSWT